MAVIKFIFITILVLWLIRAIVRLIFPVVLRNMFGTMQQQAGQAQQQYQQQRSARPEGSISIDYTPEKKKKGNADKLGDFVDFEEIK